MNVSEEIILKQVQIYLFDLGEFLCLVVGGWMV
jgi:hypothetical protein